MKGWSPRPCLALPHCLSVTSRWPLTCRVEICPSSLPDITHAPWQISHVSPTACRPKTHISSLEILRRCDKTAEWISKEQKGSWRRHHKQALEIMAWGCFSVLGGDVSGGDRNCTWSECCHAIPTAWNALDSLGFKVKCEMRLTCYSPPKNYTPQRKISTTYLYTSAFNASSYANLILYKIGKYAFWKIWNLNLLRFVTVNLQYISQANVADVSG